MSGKILWKLVATVFVAVWAYTNILPVQDTPFETHIAERATARQEEYAALLARAAAHVGTAEGQQPTLYLALRDTVNRERVDFSTFFPDIKIVHTPNMEKRNAILLRALLDESRGSLKLGLDLKGGVAFTLSMPDVAQAAEKAAAESGEEAEDVESFKERFRAERLQKAIEIMRSRVDGLGVAEPVIRARGDSAIEIQLPGLSLREDPEAINKLKKPARLEFRPVHRFARPPQLPDNWQALDPVVREQLEEALTPPDGYELLVEEREDPRTGETVEVPSFVRVIPFATGEIISQASPALQPTGNYLVNMSFTSKGRETFGNITRQIVEENTETGTTGQLAIVLDGKLYSAPTVKNPIYGDAVIEGTFTQLEAFELANVLNNPLEFELEVTEMTEVGAMLARDALDASVKAAILGASLVAAFMIVYYMAGGLAAVLTVVINIFIVIGSLAFLNATVTLPGIAALVLTIGMAVDSNILIFERMREEIGSGKDLRTALVNGFDKAFSTIVDANITTLITACILIWYGTGPVKGFGVTLAIGIVTTLFVSLITFRLFLEVLVEGGLIKRLFSYRLIPETAIPFHKYQWPAFVFSWLIVLAGVFTLVQKGNDVFGIDFLGGDEMTLHYAEEIPIQEIEKLALDKDLGEVIVNYQKMLGDREQEVLKIQTEPGRSAEVLGAMREAFPKAFPSELSDDEVRIGVVSIGAAVTDSVRWNAYMSVALALVGILLYVALRFEVGYGIGAVVATVHDVLMTIGLFVLVGGQFSAPMVAAILMIVGYSINDTIVVFDRIREELGLNPTMKLRDVLNLSINRTLSRTVLTSATTLLSAFALYYYGAGVIVDYALIFIFGIITGTFSSTFIASPIFYWWHKGDRRHVEERELLPKYDWQSSPKAE